MMCRWNLLTLAFITLLIGFCSTGALAQVDEEAKSHAWALYRALQNNDAYTFESLFQEDPVLTKKAFLYTLVYTSERLSAGDSEGTASALAFAAQLAAAIQSVFQDPVPLQILQKMAASDPSSQQLLESYATQLYPQDASTAQNESGSDEDPELYGEEQMRAADIPPQIFELFRPLTVKTLRISLAISYTDPQLILQEVDTFPMVMESFKKALVAIGGNLESADAQKWVNQLSERVELAKLDTMAEIGLLNEFGDRALDLAARDEDVNNSLAIYFTGFRVAYRQQQYDKAEAYLQKARQALSTRGEKASPVFRFVEKTSDFQLRVARDGLPNPAQAVAAFNQAWNELSPYKPMYRINDDTAWYHGRSATHFWISTIAELGQAGQAPLATITQDSWHWLQQASEYKDEDDLTPDDYLLLNAELQGRLTLLLSLCDILLQSIEENSEVMKQGIARETADGLNPFLDILGSIGTVIPLNLDQPGFPEFSLEDSAHLRELRLRLKYLKGIDPTAPKTDRLATLEALLPQMGQIEIPDQYIGYHMKIGRQFKELGRSDLATTAWERALKKAEELSFVSEATDAAALLAEEYGKRDEWQKASQYASKASLGMQEELGSSENAMGLSMAKKTSNLTALGAKAALKANDPQKALALLSEGKQMTNAAVQLSGNDEAAQATKQLQSKKMQVATLTSKVEELQKLPASVTRDEMIKKAQSLLAESKSEFLLQSRNIRQKFSRLYTTALRFDPLNLPDIQKALPARTAVVQYFATDEELYIFVVTKDQFRLRSVEEKKDDLDSSVIGYLRQVQEPVNNDPKLDSLSKKLYQILVSPIEEDLAASDTVVLIPSGKLNVLPFGALLDGSGAPFIQKKMLLELAKPTDFMKIAQTEAKPVTSVVAFANATKDLPAAEKEGEEITSLFPNSRLFKREEASKENLMKFGSKAEVLHLATHGTWDASNSLNNRLKLSHNEDLDQEEIFNLNLEGTSIVTLSACSTALADTKDVEYVASLAEAFWIAGSRSVVASLWPVDDDSTGMLMTQFYEHLKAGDGKAKSLQAAQLAVRENPRFRHPYFWSGFQLFGDYR